MYDGCISVMNNLAQDTKGYYSSVSALTPKDVQASAVEEIPAVTNTQLSFSLLFLPFCIFFGLFLGVVIVDIAKKTATVRRIMSAFAIAFAVALSPFAARMIADGNINSYLQAGPDATPRNITVRTNDDSLIVSWTTGTEATGAVRIWSEDEPGKQVVIADSGIKSRDHLAVIGNRKKASYFIEVLSGSRWYDNRGAPLVADLSGW